MSDIFNRTSENYLMKSAAVRHRAQETKPRKYSLESHSFQNLQDSANSTFIKPVFFWEEKDAQLLNA